MNKRKIIMSREESFAPSQDTYIDSIGPGKSYGVVFEINKETAYFYALSLKNNGDIQEMLDALHIFNISDVVDREVTSKLNIDWSEDGSVALLFINDSPHAMFDFTNKQGYNRTELPKGPSQSGWSKGNKKLQDSMLTDLFIFE